MRKQTTKQIDKFLGELKEALRGDYDSVTLAEHVEFKEGFKISKTYNTTLCVNGVYITYDLGEQTIEIFNTYEAERWYKWFDLADYSYTELAISIYKYLQRYSVLF